MDPELEALKDAYDTALNHFNFAHTELEINIAICELNTAETRLNNYLNRKWHGTQ